MNILITGAGGFVGKNLVESFTNDLFHVYSPDLEELDLTDSQAVQEYLKHHPIDVIVHSATTLRQGTEYCADVCEKNLRMFFNLLKHKKTQTKLINFGSGSEYSRLYWHEKMQETFFDTHIPDDSHSFSKYLISKYIENSADTSLITLRIFGIFGKYEDHRYKFISNAIAKNLLHMPITINKNVSYDYIYINDFCEIVKFFAQNKTKYSSYNVTPTKSIDLITIVNIINKISDYQSPIHVLNEGLGVHYSGNNERLCAELPHFKFSEYKNSILDLYNHYKANIDLLDKTALQKDAYLEYAKKLKNNYFDHKA
ncbi:MAG: NAD-dependent epimerase/dehydratase family protein [Methylocystaceae bacterium]|nr:NAD-dependent epimerase/dehydratase family protein [Methylocystaceae bacterium]